MTCFFFNKFSLGFAFNTYFLYRNSLQLENEVFAGQPADYMFFHLFTSGLQLAAASLFGIYVLNDGLLLSVAYLWAQHHREQIVSFMFGLQFKVRKEWLLSFFFPLNPVFHNRLFIYHGS